MIVRQLYQPRISASLIEELLITSVQDLHPSVMARLLDRAEDNVEVKESVVFAAIQRCDYQLDVIKILLDRADNNVQVTSTSLATAAQNEDHGF